MKAIILAAGLGTRLRERGSMTPKCMIRVGGRPVIERTVEWLRRFGVTEIAINLHHRPDDVRSFLRDGTKHDIRITYSYEPTLLGTAGALLPLTGWLGGEDRFLVVYGDNILDCNLNAMATHHEQLQAIATVALFRRADVSASGVAELDSRSRITAFREKPKPHETTSRWVNAGVIMCESRVCEYLPSSGPADFGSDVLPALMEACEIVAGYRMGPGESLHWIDTPKDLARVEAMFGGRQ